MWFGSGPWQIQNSHTTASLRGIHTVSSEVAWASGTSGTVLRTTDGGTTWLPCTTPPKADNLDFRGIQAFDQNTAIVMSSGKGDLSRLYKTTDACKTWKLLFTNPDKEGFWDAISFDGESLGALLGDPVRESFTLFESRDGGKHWYRQIHKSLKARVDSAAFAASNSTLFGYGFGTGGGP